MTGAPLLSSDTVVAFLRDRGVLDGSDARVRELDGGVSSVVYRVETAYRSVVVKQALPRLRVQTEWEAKRERTLSEAAALAILHDLTPSRVPEVVDVDGTLMAVTLQAAPPDAGNWKAALLSDPAAAAGDVPVILGDTVGRWHRCTRGRADLLDRFDDDEAFEQLRVAPFHRELQRVHPQVASALGTCIDDLTTSRECLVHGDFSPKNVLVGDDLCWMIDAEVARIGAPVFDVAFMISHLMLKSVHSGHPAVLREAVDRFTDAYASASGGGTGMSHVGRNVAALLLARVDGKSPVDYLTVPEQRHVRIAAFGLLGTGDPSITDVWDALAGGAR